MPYVKNPIVYPSGKVSEDTAQINTNFSILADAFYNSDPENSPIYRACYVGITAPLNPKVGQIWVDISVAPPVIKVYNGTNWLEVKPASVDQPSTPYIGQLWLDTSVNPPILKIYDGTNWQSNVSNADKLDGQEGSYYLNRANHTGTQPPSTISPQGSGSGLDADKLDTFHASLTPGPNIIVPLNASGVLDLSATSALINAYTIRRINGDNLTSDYPLAVGEEVFYTWDTTVSLSKLLRIATQEGFYEMEIVFPKNTVNATLTLNPNNTTYSNAFTWGAVGIADGGSAGGGTGTVSSFYFHKIGLNGFNRIFISTFTVNKICLCLQRGYNADVSTIAVHVICSSWNETTTAWTSLGTLVAGAANGTARIRVRRLA